MKLETAWKTLEAIREDYPDIEVCTSWENEDKPTWVIIATRLTEDGYIDDIIEGCAEQVEDAIIHAFNLRSS